MMIHTFFSCFECFFSLPFFQDANGLLKVIHFLAKEYQWKHRRPLTVHAMSHLLGTQLYMRRQLPYYSFCILGGIDTSGMGAVYQYDSIGSFERTKV